ncbi:DUF4124 domain-containing protein [Herbaspirillum sp. HC18]|nr:DUF4124 domain-containing protein [Herbaspirillum sp. HC18]
MRPLFLLTAMTLALSPALVSAGDLAPPSPIGEPAKKVYRQVMPDGRIVYSDKPVKGAKLDEVLTVDPSPEGAPTESKPRPPGPVVNEPTPVERVSSIPESGKRKTLDDAEADIIRAQMLLDDARKRQEAGVEPLAGERTGNASGGSRLNDAYYARQKRLAEEVAVAENVLKKSVSERDAIRDKR